MRQVDPIPLPLTGARAAFASLTETRCTDPDFAGADLAALARLRHVLPMPPTVLAVGPPSLWTSPATAGRALRDLRQLLGPFSVATTIRSTLPSTGQQVGPVWYNVGPAALEDAMIELAGIGLRQTGTDGSARLVMAVQMFVPPDVSVLATVEPMDGAIRLRSCWGLDEDLGAGVWHDTLVLRWPTLAVEARHVVHKPTATAAAGGGTQVVDVTPALRGKPSLPLAQAVPVAQACARMALQLGTAAEFEIAMAGSHVYLLACHPH